MADVVDRDTLSEEHLLIIDMANYGVTLLTAMEEGGAVGARFDSDFEGEMIGDRVKGTSVGTLYLFVTGGPSLMVRRYSRVLTEDHARVAVSSEGYGRYYSADEAIKFSESTTFYSAHPNYRWLDGPARIGSGTLDLADGTIEVTTTSSRGPVLHTVGSI